MGEDQDSAAASANDGAAAAPKRYFSSAPHRFNLRALGLNALLVIAPVAIYYVAVVQKQVESDQERAFRSLAEINTQFDNYLNAAGSLWQMGVSGDTRPEMSKAFGAPLSEQERQKVFAEWLPYYRTSYKPWSWGVSVAAGSLCVRMGLELQGRQHNPYGVADAAVQQVMEGCYKAAGLPMPPPAKEGGPFAQFPGAELSLAPVRENVAPLQGRHFLHPDIVAIAAAAADALHQAHKAGPYYPPRSDASLLELAAGLANTGQPGSGDGFLESFLAQTRFGHGGCDRLCWDRLFEPFAPSSQPGPGTGSVQDDLATAFGGALPPGTLRKVAANWLPYYQIATKPDAWNMAIAAASVCLRLGGELFPLQHNPYGADDAAVQQVMDRCYAATHLTLEPRPGRQPADGPFKQYAGYEIGLALLRENALGPSPAFMRQDIVDIANAATRALPAADQRKAHFPPGPGASLLEWAAGLANPGLPGSGDGLLEDFEEQTAAHLGNCDRGCWDRIFDSGLRSISPLVEYGSHLAMPGLSALKPRPADSSDPCSRQGRPEDEDRSDARYARIRREAGGTRIEIYPCQVPRAQNAPPPLAWSFPVSAAIAAENLAPEFDQVIVALPDGTVLAAVARGRINVPPDEQVQSAGSAQSLANVKEILERGAQEEWPAGTQAKAPKDKEGQDADKEAEPHSSEGGGESHAAVGKAPGLVVQLEQKIGGLSYTAFVVPHPVGTVLVRDPSEFGHWDQDDAPARSGQTGGKSAGTKDSAAVQRVRTLYIIGLKSRSSFDLPRALDPATVCYVTFAVIATLLMLPLLRLLLLEKHDSITRGHARSIALCLICSGALLAVVVLSFLSFRTVTSWARVGARNYGQALEQTFLRDLGELLQLTASYETYFRDTPPDRLASLRYSPDPDWEQKPHLIRGNILPCTYSNSTTVDYLRIGRQESPPGERDWKNWSPLRTAFKLTRDDDYVGLAMTAFECHDRTSIRSSALADRPYFRFLRNEISWTWPPPEGCAGQPCVPYAGGFIAQRLFDRSTGAKLLQVAVPNGRYDPAHFSGVISGDAGMPVFSAAVPPLDYGFAIVDVATGTVLFHSDDSRSLVENFYMETDDNPQLLAAARASRPAYFEGRYRGHLSGFDYRPLAGVPWGLVVVYPLEPLQEAVMYAGFMTVSAYAGGFIFCAGLLFVALAVVRRRNYWAWPQWRLAKTYPLALVLLGLYLPLQIIVVAVVEHRLLPVVFIAQAMFIPAAGSLLFAERASQNSYASTLRGGLVLGSLLLDYALGYGAAHGHYSDLPLWAWIVAGAIPALSAFAGRPRLALALGLPALVACISWNALAWLLPTLLVISTAGLAAGLRWVLSDKPAPRLPGPLQSLKQALEHGGQGAFVVFFGTLTLILYLPMRVVELGPVGVLPVLVLLAAVLTLFVAACWAQVEVGAGRDDRGWSTNPWELRSPLRWLGGSYRREVFAQRYAGCAFLCVLILGALPAGAFYMHSLGWQMQGLLQADLLRSAEAMEKRRMQLHQDLIHLVPDQSLRHNDYPTAAQLARWLPVPGFTSSPDQAPWCLAVSILPESPVGCPDLPSPQAHGSDWDILAWLGRKFSDMTPQRSLNATLVDDGPGGHPHGASTSALVVRKTLADGKDLRVALQLGDFSGLRLASPSRVPGAEPGADFMEELLWGSAWVVCFALPIMFLVMTVARRLLGIHIIMPRASAATADQDPATEGDSDKILNDFREAFGGMPRLVFMDYEALKIAKRRQPGRGVPKISGVLEALRLLNPGGDVTDLVLEEDLARARGVRSGRGKVLCLKNLDAAVAYSKERREAVLALLERAVADDQMKLFVGTDFSPIPILCRQGGVIDEALLRVDEPEAARWRQVFSKLRWISLTDELDKPRASISGGKGRVFELVYKVERECSLLWPKLHAIRRELLDSIDSKAIRTEGEIDTYVDQQAEAFFASMWQYCTVPERLALYQLARGDLLNPCNREILERLIRRRLVVPQPDLRLASSALARFIRDAESPEVFARWQDDAATGSWQLVRTPIFVVLLLLVAWLAYTSGDVFKILTATLGTTALFAGNIFKLFGFLRGGDGQK